MTSSIMPTAKPTVELSPPHLAFPTIDIHCHATKRALPDTIDGCATLEKIVEKMEQHTISQTVLLASYFPHKQSGIANYRLAKWIDDADSSRFLLFGSLDFEHYFYQGYNELEELALEGALKGIKIYTCYQNIDLTSDKMQKIAALAQTYALPLMFHVGYSYSSMRTTGRVAVTDAITPLDIEPLARAHEINFILSHLSKPFTSELITVLNRNSNMYTDTSGLIDSKYDREEIPQAIGEIRQVLEQCGPEKVLFGTDFPVQTYEDSFYMVDKALQGFSREDKEKVYANNARKILPQGRGR